MRYPAINPVRSLAAKTDRKRGQRLTPPHRTKTKNAETDLKVLDALISMNLIRPSAWHALPGDQSRQKFGGSEVPRLR